MIKAKQLQHFLFTVFLLLFIAKANNVNAQTKHTEQFWSEITFTKPLPKAWSTEFNIGETFGGDQENKSPFTHFEQWYLRGWVYYYPSARWKLGMFIARYQNNSVEGIGQEKNNEWRWALQGMYYFHKIGYTFNARTRIENRGITNEEGLRENVTRFRQQLRLLYPFGSRSIRGKIFYGIASDEVFFKTKSEITGNQFFDRNRLTLGGGYAIMDDIQVELTYVNEYLPRKDVNEMYHAIQLSLVFNNIISNAKHRWHKDEKNTAQPPPATDE